MLILTMWRVEVAWLEIALQLQPEITVLKKAGENTVRLVVVLLTIAAALVPTHVRAHGSVVDEDDLCLINIGFYRAHFTIYQPRFSGHEEYCEDLPAGGETVFIIEYLHETMREVPFDFRIVHDRQGIGRFARYEDVLALDLERDTVFYQPPRVEPDAVFTVLHEFPDPGDYIGVVTVEHPTSDEIYRAVFPFQVGGWPWMVMLWAASGTAVLALLLFWWRWSRAQTREPGLALVQPSGGA